MFERLSTPERIAIAKDKVSRVVDHLLYVLELHENNAIILYSPTLLRRYPNHMQPTPSTCFNAECINLKSFACAHFGTALN